MYVHPLVRIAVDLVLVLLCAGLFALRLFAIFRRGRYPRTGRCNWATAFLSAALLLAWCDFGALTWSMLQHYRYRHRPHGIDPVMGLPPDVAVVQRKVTFVQLVLYATFIWLTKLAYVAIYAELWELLTRRFRVALGALGVVVAATYITNILLTFLWCRGFATNFEVGTKNLCSPAGSLTPVVVLALGNVATDLGLLALGMTLISFLNIRRKSAIKFCVGLGVVTVMMAITRAVVVIWMERRARAVGIEKTDGLQDMHLVCESEMAVAYGAACAPGLRNLGRRRNEKESVSS